MDTATMYLHLRAGWSLQALSEAVQRRYAVCPDHGARCGCFESVIATGARIARLNELTASDRTRGTLRHVLTEISRRV